MGYDTEDFATDVIDRSFTVPVLVDFWAEWCGPCKVLGPVLERLAQQQTGSWVLTKVDTERHPTIAAQYAIRSIPNVKLFVDGKVSNEFVGALPEPQVVEWLRQALPSKYRTQLDGAKQLLEEGSAAKAEEILQTVVAAEPGNDQAIVLLAQAVLSSDPSRAVGLVAPVALGSEYFDSAEAVRALANMFTIEEDLSLLPVDSARDVYLAAIRAARAGDFEAAIDGFVDVIRRNRYYDDDGARKACIAIFRLLGEDHPVTKSQRIAFSSALY